jgi:hypothetical protein
MSLTVSGAWLLPFGPVGLFANRSQPRDNDGKRGNIPQCLVSKFLEAFRSVGIRRHRTNERLGSFFRAGGAERWLACLTWRAS